MENYKEHKQIKEIQLGCDPEFLILDRFKILDASLHNFAVKNFGSLGNDGHKYIAELRPNYSSNPLDLIHNMRGIMISKIHQNPKFAEYDFYAGSYYQEKSLGGHIHFSSSCNSIKNMSDNQKENCTFILDNYLTACSILLESIEDGKKRRQSGDYGFYGDWRPQTWGFEHRTCSSWIASPAISAALLCLAKVIMHEIVNNPNFPFQILNCNDEFHYMRIEKIRARFPKIWRDIQSMSLYPKYKPYVDLIYTLVDKKLTWFPKNKKLKEAWGIINTKVISNNYERFKPISIETIWRNVGKEMPKPKVKEDTFGYDNYGNYLEGEPI